jgi:hypothetical protein
LGLLYLSYFEKLARRHMPSEFEIKHWDRDEELAYKRADLKEILKITKNMHDNPEKNDFIAKNVYDCPEGDDFKYILTGNKNRQGQKILRDMINPVVLDNYKGPFIIKNSKDLKL